MFRADDVWVKAHRTPRKYAQERAAYLDVVPALAAAGLRVPALLHRDDALGVLVLSHVSGAPASPTSMRDQADAFLTTLHALPCPSADPIPLSEAIPRRLDGWIARARPHLPAAIPDRARREIGDGAAFVGQERVWCHRDWAAHNWLDDDGVLGVIDFEHAGPDLWLVDLLKLPHEPTALSPDDAERFRQLQWLHAIATLAWAAEHGDATWAEAGRALLDRLTARR